MLSVNRAQECSGHPLPVCIASLQISRWRAFCPRTRPCHTGMRSSRGFTQALPTRCTAFQNPPCDHVPGCGAEACCVCSSVAVAIWLQIPGSVRAGDEARRRRRRENSICTGCFSSLQLHPAASSTTCRNKVQRTGKTVYATVLRIRSSVRSLDSSAPLLSSSPFVGCRALHSCVWRGSLLKSWEPTAA